jgi:riboflavin synthase
MFTGIIEDLGIITAIEKRIDSFSINIQTKLPVDTIQLGDSIAVNGVCLTVTMIEKDRLSFDVSHETYQATTLRRLNTGDVVHLERALALGSRLGGHLVTGHVDGVGEVISRVPKGKNLDLVILAPKSLEAFLISKGSIAIDGVSLTINQPDQGKFRVTLVPHTLEKTYLNNSRIGASVNLEADIIGKYVYHYASLGVNKGRQTNSGRIDQDFLKEHGFL